MRLFWTGVIAAFAVSLTAAGQSGAAFPAQHQRLVIVTEAGGFSGLRFVGPANATIDLGIPLGVGGSAAVSPDGRQVALNLSIPFDPGDPSTTGLATTDFLGTAGGGLIARDVARGGRPSWSPDGTKIAYAAKADGKWDVFVSAADGNGPVDLTNDAASNDRNPRWSPDGSKIAFESDRTGNWDVFSMSADGSAQTDLTNDPADDRLGDWSPDSSRIVFSSWRSGGGDLYTMARSGGAATRLTSLPAAETHAAWSPDGTTIAFSNDTDDSEDVYEVAPDGSNLQRLTDNGYADIVQDWQPLQDIQAPVVRAVASSGVRGKTARFRFRVSEETGVAGIDITYEYGHRDGSSFGGVSTLVAGIKPGHTYSVPFPPRALQGAPKHFRFCVQGTDSSLNQSAQSCARFTLVTPKKKKKR